MAIVKMKRLQVLALERDHDAILRRLQHMGCLEISEPDTEALPDTLRRCDTATADCLARQRQLQTAMDTLRRTAPPPKAGLLTPRPRIAERDYLDEASLAAELETAQRINELAADINRLTAKETQLRSEQAALRPWRSLDVPLELTETEFSILHCLAENRGRVVPVRTIYETVWHETYMPASNNTVMVHIVNLRKKLEEDPANPRLIRTVWGKGYQID